MSRYKRLPRTAEKRRDEFVSLVDHSIRWGIEHRRTVLLLVALVVIGGLATFAFGQYQEKRLVSLNQTLVSVKEGGERDAAYQSFIQRSGELKPLTQLDEAHRLLEENRSDEAMKKVDEVLAAPNPVAGSYPLLLKAHILEVMGKRGEAIALYDEVIAKEEEESFVKKMALARLIFLKSNLEEETNHE